jgi:thioredoxin family protein
MTPIICLLLLAGLRPAPDVQTAASLFDRGLTWQQFLSGVMVQRDLWLKNAAAADLPPGLSERLTRVSQGLRLVIVAEDSCTDSVNTVPYIARLASSAHLDVRIIDRTLGEPLMKRHHAPGGRTATPVVVLVRNGRDVGAWVERPAVLQQLFLSITANPENGRRLAQRQSWYDHDRGRTTLKELVALAERTALSR